jgi:sugar O-acyltransferase (sialic acid O-acetyltransferase NeuD family)
MKPFEVILIGGGQHARVALDVLLAMPVQVCALFDPKYEGAYRGVIQLADYQPHLFPDAHALVTIGDNATRARAAARCAHRFHQLAHPSALVSAQARVGEGSMILHHAVVQVDSVIGRHVIINTGAQVDHDCVIGDFAHIAPGAVLCGAVSVGEGTLVGAGAVVIPGVKIGKQATVGAGSVVIRDVPDFARVAGNPAKPMSKK